MPRSVTSPVTMAVRAAGKVLMGFSCGRWVLVDGGRAELFDELLHGHVGLIAVRNEFGGALRRDVEESRSGLGAQLARLHQVAEDLGCGKALREFGLKR